MWVINPAVGCHYFSPGLQLHPQSIRGLLPILLLGGQRHSGCEQFAQNCYPTASRLRFEPGSFCAWVQHANHSATEPPSSRGSTETGAKSDVYDCLVVVFRIVSVRETRVTSIVSHVFIGLSVLFIEQLKLIPRPVLDGLFLYLLNSSNPFLVQSSTNCCSVSWTTQTHSSTSTRRTVPVPRYHCAAHQPAVWTHHAPGHWAGLSNV